MLEPTIREETPGQVTQAAQARWWRRQTVRLTREQLSDLSGFSITSIKDFERGCNSHGDLIGAAAWQRYRLICAAVAHKLNKWEWT